MITGMYSSASGMMVEMKRQDMLASNLATSMLPGGKRENLIIRSFPDVTLNATYKGLTESLEQPRFNHAIGRVGTGAGIDWAYTDYEQGTMVQTGDPHDISLMGDGYLAILTPDGTRYTRNGRFYTDSQRRLVTPEGHYLAGQGTQAGGRISPIRIASPDFEVNEEGKVFDTVYDPATGAATRRNVDTIRVVDFDNRDLLMKEGNNLYRLDAPDPASHLQAPKRYRVAQGYIEKANSVPTKEMVYLMDSQRAFEANARVLKAADQTLQQAVREVGRIS